MASLSLKDDNEQNIFLKCIYIYIYKMYIFYIHWIHWFDGGLHAVDVLTGGGINKLKTNINKLESSMNDYTQLSMSNARYYYLLYIETHRFAYMRFVM